MMKSSHITYAAMDDDIKSHDQCCYDETEKEQAQYKAEEPAEEEDDDEGRTHHSVSDCHLR